MGNWETCIPTASLIGSKSGQKIIVEVSRVVIASEQHRLCRGLYGGIEAEAKRTIDLRNQADQLIAGVAIQRTDILGGSSRQSQTKQPHGDQDRT